MKREAEGWGRGRLRITMKEQGKWGIQRTGMGIPHTSLASFFKANISGDILKKEKEYRPQSLFLILNWRTRAFRYHLLIHVIKTTKKLRWIYVFYRITSWTRTHFALNKILAVPSKQKLPSITLAMKLVPSRRERKKKKDESPFSTKIASTRGERAHVATMLKK